MGQQQEFKIRALPRGSEKKAASTGKSRPTADAASNVAGALARPQRWIIYVGTAAVVALIGAFALPGSKPQATAVARATTSAPRQTDLASVQDPVSAKVTRHLQDSYIKEEIQRQKLQLDNMKIKDPSLSEETFAQPDDGRVYGVQLDQEDTSDKLFRDLNYRQQSLTTDYLPEERINARLANNKWKNEFERTERINFIRNFIRSAYERGYEVEIDQNLVVVGVRKIQERKVTIDQIFDRMAKQGY